MSLLLELGFSENTGTATADSSGNSRNGTLTGNVSWATGKNGAGVSQTSGRANNSRVAVPRSGLEPSSALTIMAWVKTSTAVAYDPIVEKPQSGTAQSYALWSSFGGSGVPYVTVTTSVTGTVNQDATTNIHDGSWHHVAATYDGSLVKIFVDGTQEAQVSATGTIVYDTNDVGVGGSPYWTTEYVDGTIDEVRIFDTALTAGDIATYKDTPVVGGDADVTSVASTLTLAARAPAVTGIRNATVAAVAVAVALATPIPTISGETVVSGGGAASITLAARAPVVRGGANVVAVTATVTSAGRTPSVTGGSASTVNAVTATASAAARTPTVTAVRNATVTSVAATVTLNALTPTALELPPGSVVVVVAALTAAVVAPTVTAGATVTAVNAPLTAAAITPAVTTFTVSTQRILTVVAEARALTVAAETRALTISREA